MALVFPLSLAAFADKLRIASAPFVLQEQQQLSGLGTGDVIAAQLAPSRLTAQVTIAPMSHIKAREIQALIESLNGPQHSFYLYSPANCYPADDPGGVKLGSSTVTIASLGANNKSLALSGLPAGYKITAGDALSFDYGVNPVRRAYHRAAEGAVATGGGATPQFELSHPLRPGVVTGVAVTLKKPAAKMFIEPGSLSIQHAGSLSTISFKAVQRP